LAGLKDVIEKIVEAEEEIEKVLEEGEKSAKEERYRVERELEAIKEDFSRKKEQIRLRYEKEIEKARTQLSEKFDELFEKGAAMLREFINMDLLFGTLEKLKASSERME